MKKQFNWKEIWENKGKIKTNNLKLLDGFEETTINPKKVAKKISELLNIKKTDRVLEVGCGAGMLAQFFNCDYVGVDYSITLLKKHSKILKNSVFCAEANKLNFKDNSFDIVIVYSVFQYFPNKNYAKEVLKELKRVCSRVIFIGDIPIKSHCDQHLIYSKNDFNGEISEGFYNKDRYNVMIKYESN